jgi:hypothetical protein
MYREMGSAYEILVGEHKGKYLDPRGRDWREAGGDYIMTSFIQVTKSRRMRWMGRVALMGLMRNLYEIFVGKPEWKRPLRRPRSGGEDNIRMDPREVGWEGVDLMNLAQDRDQWRSLVNTVMSLRVP